MNSLNLLSINKQINHKICKCHSAVRSVTHRAGRIVFFADHTNCTLLQGSHDCEKRKINNNSNVNK